MGDVSLAAIDREMRDHEPVFIVGAPRSGTNLLGLILQKHGVFAARRMNLTETHVLEYLPKVFLFAEGRPKSLQRFMLNDADAYRRFLRTIRLLRVRNAALGPGNVLLKPDRATWWWTRANASGRILRAFFYFAREARGVERIVEKTPSHWRYLDLLYDAFPHGRMLYLVRHPVDQFSSYRRRARMKKSKQWAHVDPFVFCDQYVRATETVLARAERGVPVEIIRYEDLTGFPERTMQEVFDRLGVAFDPATLEGDSSISRRREPLLGGPIVEESKDWRAFVTGGDAVSIETRLGSLMQRFGYSAYTD
jgi:hypothetical protein